MKMDLTNMISNGTEEIQVPEQKLTKEEYAAKKQQETLMDVVCVLQIQKVRMQI